MLNVAKPIVSCVDAAVVGLGQRKRRAISLVMTMALVVMCGHVVAQNERYARNVAMWAERDAANHESHEAALIYWYRVAETQPWRFR